jgi:hypothetical protein
MNDSTNPAPHLLAIVLEGGVVQSVVATCDLPNLDILVIDYDTEGVDPGRVITVPQSDGSLAEANAGFLPLERSRIDLAAVAVQLMRQVEDAG